MAKPKPKLTFAQNTAVKDLAVREKLVLLHQWRKNGDITEETYQYHLNHWIKKEGIKILNLKKATSGCFEETLDRDLHASRSIISCEIEKFIQKLRGKLNLYVQERNSRIFLSKNDYTKFEEYVTKYSETYRKLVDELLILGLRFPDANERINLFSSAFVEEFKKGKNVDYLFWGMLWEDVDFVPLDAVRLMLESEGRWFKLDSCFEPSFIASIIPLMEAQRDKEILRFQTTDLLEGKEQEQQRSRKMDRLAYFNTLIMVSKSYCGLK